MRLASRGLRDMGTGEEAVADQELAEALRGRARAILLKSLLLAGVLSAAVLLWPSG